MKERDLKNRVNINFVQASLFRPVYALDVNNKVVLGDQSLSQLPVIMPLRCAQRGKAAQSERMFSSAEQPADTVLQQRGEVRKGIAGKPDLYATRFFLFNFFRESCSNPQSEAVLYKDSTLPCAKTLPSVIDVIIYSFLCSF